MFVGDKKIIKKVLFNSGCVYGNTAIPLGLSPFEGWELLYELPSIKLSIVGQFKKAIFIDNLQLENIKHIQKRISSSNISL